MSIGSIARTIGGGIATLVGIGAQAAKHENCAWIGLEVLLAAGVGALALELGLRWRPKTQ